MSNDTLNKLLEDVSNELLDGIFDNNDRQLVLEGFKKYLENIYKEYFVKYQDNYGLLLKFIYKTEKSFLNSTPEYKVNFYKYQKIDNQIIKFSNLALDLALQYHKSGLLNPQYEQIRMGIMSGLNQLKAELRDATEEMIFSRHMSETILELEYAGGKSKALSFRMKDRIV